MMRCRSVWGAGVGSRCGTLDSRPTFMYLTAPYFPTLVRTTLTDLDVLDRPIVVDGRDAEVDQTRGIVLVVGAPGKGCVWTAGRGRWGGEVDQTRGIVLVVGAPGRGCVWTAGRGRWGGEGGADQRRWYSTPRIKIGSRVMQSS